MRIVRIVLPLIVMVTMVMGGGVANSVRAASVKIAIMGPFTGDAASVGLEQLNFAKVAVADFNKASGMSVELLEVDTQLNPANALTAAQRIVSDDTVLGVVGPAGSQEVAAVAPIFDPAGIAFISPSATRTALSGTKGFFRVVPRDDVQGKTDADFMASTLKAKMVYVIDDQTSYSTGLADVLQTELTAQNVKFQRDSITQKDTDFSALVTKMKGTSPDVVFMPFQIATQASQIAKQMQEQGVKATVFGADGTFDPDGFIKQAGGATEGAYVSLFAPDVRDVADAKDIVAEYVKQYDDKFGSFGAPSYAATLVMLEALQRATKAGTATRATVAAEVAKTDQKTSILGIPIKFDDKGDVVGATFFIYQVKGSKFVLVPQAESMGAAATQEATQTK